MNMKSPMKKNYVVSCLICIIAFFSYSYTSYVLGADKMGREKEYTVTINGIEMYKDAATILLRQIIKEEKDSVSIVDKNTEKNLDASTEILKPEMNVLINNSKNVANVSELFEILKEHAVKFPDKIEHGVFKGRNITSMKLDNSFCASDGFSQTFLCVNGKTQITKMYIFRSSIPSDIEKAIPMHE
jgi:hypothetical protein